MNNGTHKEQFISILRKVNNTRDEHLGQYDVEGMIQFLEGSDFFEAPASTKYAFSHKGGLCEHSISVYKTLSKLNKTLKNPYPEDSIILIGLLHNIHKINYFESAVVNKKVYIPNGSKYDDNGRFDWVSEKVYKVKDPSERLLIGTGGVHSYMFVSSYGALSNDETIALVNYPIGLDSTNYHFDLPHIMNRCNLTVILNAAENMCSYCELNWELKADV